MHRHGAIEVVCETYGAQVLGIRPDDRCLSAAKAFFAYGLGNSLLFPLSVGAAARAGAGAVPAGRCIVGRGRRNTARRCSSPGRRSSPTCSRAGLPADALAGVRLAASRRRGAARRAVPAVDRALRRRHPRRHRHDRDAAHLPVQPPGRGPPGHHRRRRARLRPADRSTRTGARGAAPARPARCSSAATPPPPATGPATTPPARSSRASGCAPATPTSQDADGYYSCLGRTGDMLKASGIWVVARPRSRRGCWPTTRSPRPWWSRRPTPTGWRSRSRTWSCGRARGGDRGRADRVLPRRRCRRSSGRARSCSWPATRPRRPARSAGSSCATMAATVLVEPLPPVARPRWRRRRT